MIHVAGPTDLFWTVAMGMGFAVLAVVIVLLNLLLKSVRALDTRVEDVWSAAVGVHAVTSTAGPQLRRAEQALAGAVTALRGAAQPAVPVQPPAPRFQPSTQRPGHPGRRW